MYDLAADRPLARPRPTLIGVKALRTTVSGVFAAPADVGVAPLLVPLIAWGTLTVGRLVLDDGTDAHPLDLGPALGLGVSLFALAVLAVGFVSTSRQAFAAVIGLFVVAGVPAWRRTLVAVAEGARRVRSIEGAVLAAIITGVVLLCLLSGARPPGARDEVDYHWTGPVAWVAEGRWIELPTIRLVNAPALAERLYTVAAAFDSSTAAHWLHTLFFVCLIASAGRVAHAFGGRAAVAMAVIASVPVLLNQASIAYNDIAFAALLVAAAATALTARDARRWAAIGAMVAAAILVKPLAAVFAPALALLILLARPVERSIVAGAVAGGATLALGAAYNLAVLGSLGPDRRDSNSVASSTSQWRPGAFPS